MNPRKQDCRICAAPRKERTSHKRNKPQEWAKQWPTKQGNPNKKHNQRVVESHRSRVEQNQGDSREPEQRNLEGTRIQPIGPRQLPHHSKATTTTQSPQNPRTQTRCAPLSSAGPDFGRDQKKLVTMTCQEGSASGRLKTAMLADLRKDLEAAQQDLPQPLPRNTCARNGKGGGETQAGYHDRTAKIQSLEAVKQQLEKDASEIQKRLEEAEMERDHAFNQMSQEKKSPKLATSGSWDIKPIVDTWMSETAHTLLGDPTQKQAWFREQLCKHMTNLVHADPRNHSQQSYQQRFVVTAQKPTPFSFKNTSRHMTKSQ